MSSYRYSSDAFQYEMFLFECAIEDYKFDMFVNEALVMENDMNAISLVHEGAMDKIKEGFKKLIASITALWGKFMAKVNELTKSDQGYLKKYKDIILKQKVKEEKYVLYPYWKGMDNLLASKVPAFNYNSMKDELASDEDFIKKYFSAYNKKEGYIETAKTVFRGAAKQLEIPGYEINMTNMYNFCMDYQNAVKKLELDMKAIEKAANDAITQVSRLEKTTVKESYGFDSPSMIYSYLKESTLILEEPLVGKASDTQNEDKTTKTSKAMENIDKGDESNTSSDKEELKVNSENRGEDIDRMKRYIKLCYGFLGAKMQILEETYQAYMFIIRDHVKSYNGQKSDKTDAADAKQYQTSGKKNASVEDDNTKDEPMEKVSIVDKVKGAFNKKKKKAGVKESYYGYGRMINESMLDD